MSKKISLSVFIFVLLASILATFMTAFAIASHKHNSEIAKIYDDLAGQMLGGSTGGNSGNTLKGDFAELELINEIFKQFAYTDFDEETVMTAVIKAYAEATGDKYAAYYTG